MRFICLVLLFAATFARGAIPDWYFNNQTFEEPNAYQFIAFASGASFAEAEKNAKESIASSIQSSVSSRTEISVSMVGDVVDESFNNQAIHESQYIFEYPLKVLKRERVDGIYYIAAWYDISPLPVRLMNASYKECHHSNVYFDRVVSGLSGSVLCIESPILSKKSDHWFFYYGLDKYVKLSDADYRSLLLRTKSEEISVKLSSARVTPNSYYQINLSAKKDGYLSLVQLYQSGEVAVLLENEKVKAGSIQTFPNPQLYEGLLSDTGGKDITTDLSIAYLCSMPIDLSQFETISTQANYENSDVSAVFTAMDKCSIATDVLTTSTKL